jgi:hypothetical protein
MIRLLLALHPRAWRARYGEEYRELMEVRPLTARTVVDVVQNAVRQHDRAHPRRVRLVAAVSLMTLVEIAALRADLTANLLWAPTTPLRAFVLVAALAPWLPSAGDLVAMIRGRRLLRTGS